MTEAVIGWQHNPTARAWLAGPMAGAPRDFHRSLAGYAPTPLIEVAGLARELGVGRVLVKDESYRLGLPAFKILGASYATARELSRRLGSDAPLPVAELRRRLAATGLSLVAATDGNHGRAVARMASLLGIPATISVPAGVSAAAREAIVAEGATLVELDLPYDDVVRHVADGGTDQAVLIQDTSWPGYRDVPGWIVDGYDTMLGEVDEQLGGAPDLVVVPAGVGCFAQSVISHYRRDGHRPALLAVEPDAAASVTAALAAGRIVTAPTGTTIMTGLNCGTVSELAWPALAGGLDAAVTVTDDQARDAVSTLAGYHVDSGPCGAATLAGARAVCGDGERRAALGLAADAVVVLLSTEGRAANPTAE
jgi:diaminopropionate ammonia-lyase